MPFKTFVAGTTALASDINTYLMNQSVMVFTNSAARSAALGTPTEGMVTYLTDNDHYAIYNGATWTNFDMNWSAWTPTITGITLGTGSSITCLYARVGRTMFIQGRLLLGTSPTGVGSITITLPSGSYLAYYGDALGTCIMRDALGGVTYQGNLITPSSTTLGFNAIGASGTYATVVRQSAAVPFTWASAANHYITFSGMYYS